MGKAKKTEDALPDDTEAAVAAAEEAYSSDATSADATESTDVLEDALALEDELDALRAERDEMRDRFMRALADAENTRKRGERDRREAEQYGGTKIARDMLPVFDNLRRALEAAGDAEGKANEALVEGVELTLRELISVFSKHGIEPIVPEVGDRFDPQLHQAMFEAPVPGTKAGDIIQVSALGFTIHERLLRPAQVGVSSTPAS